MLSQVILTITQGKLAGRQFTFDSRMTCVVGRGTDCYVKLPDDDEHSTISRYHCLLDINPPLIRVRDFGSKNGTYVNGEKIGQRERHQTPEEASRLSFPEYDLQTGDEIKLGNTVFEVLLEVNQEINLPADLIADTINIPDYQPEKINFLEFIKRLLGFAESGSQQLQGIRGYKLGRLLGKGGFGEVYLAQHEISKQFVALKVMSPAIAANERAIKMFLRETENTKFLQHPNVVRLLDYGFWDGIFFFTMEYCDRSTVADLMEHSGGRLSVDVALPIILQVLDGLSYAHNAEIPYVQLGDGSFGQGKGLVHRDLKPSNIFLSNVDGDVVAKIGDYGLAKAFDLAGLSGFTFTGNKAGSPGFMCRQQLLDFKYARPEVDIWSAAACLYNMLTGYLPRNFTGDPWLAVLKNNPVPICERNASIPKKLAEVIDLALVEKPEIYFQTAQNFKEALLSIAILNEM